MGTSLSRAPLWKGPVARRAVAIQGARSWDLYGDVYEPAWDDVAAAARDAGVAAVGDWIGLTVDFLERASGRTLTGGERALVAKLVRQHGKAALFGFSKGVNATEKDDPREWFRYALAVAQRTVAEIRTKQGEST